MLFTPNSIRSFIGAKNFQLSSAFYRDIGFEELQLSPQLAYFKIDQLGFYLQDYYVKDWVENTMLFLEVPDVAAQLAQLKALNLKEQYSMIKLSEIQDNDWGQVFFLHDPAGILWQIGAFK